MGVLSTQVTKLLAMRLRVVAPTLMVAQAENAASQIVDVVVKHGPITADQVIDTLQANGLGEEPDLVTAARGLIQAQFSFLDYTHE